MYRWLLSENRCGRVTRDLFETISHYISVALTKHHSASKIALWLLNSATQGLPSTEKTSFMDLLFRRQSTFQLYIPVKNLRIAPVVGPSLMVQENHVAPSSVRSDGWTHRIRPGMLAHLLDCHTESLIIWFRRTYHAGRNESHLYETQMITLTITFTISF